MVLAFLKGVIVDVVSEMSEKSANVQMTQIINNNKTVIYLCEQCAREEGKFNVISPFSINDFFSGFMVFHTWHRLLSKTRMWCVKPAG